MMQFKTIYSPKRGIKYGTVGGLGRIKTEQVWRGGSPSNRTLRALQRVIHRGKLSNEDSRDEMREYIAERVMHNQKYSNFFAYRIHPERGSMLRQHVPI